MTTQNISYKVGQEITIKYVPPVLQRYTIGQLVDVFDDKTHERLATFEVLEENRIEIKGKVIVTYNHKRRKQ